MKEEENKEEEGKEEEEGRGGRRGNLKVSGKGWEG